MAFPPLYLQENSDIWRCRLNNRNNHAPNSYQFTANLILAHVLIQKFSTLIILKQISDTVALHLPLLQIFL